MFNKLNFEALQLSESLEIQLKDYLINSHQENKIVSINQLQNELSIGFTRAMIIKRYLIETNVVNDKGEILINPNN